MERVVFLILLSLGWNKLTIELWERVERYYELLLWFDSQCCHLRRLIETNICFEGQILAATLNELASIYVIKMQISDDVVVESSSTSKVNEEVSVLTLLFLKQGQWKEFFVFVLLSLGWNKITIELWERLEWYYELFLWYDSQCCHLRRFIEINIFFEGKILAATLNELAS